MRLTLGAILALFGTGAFADCREATGSRQLGFKTALIWHARTDCGGSTMLWIQSFAGVPGAGSALRVDDLLIVPETDSPQAQTLSLLAPVEVECRLAADRDSLVIATGEWNSKAAQGARQAAGRAWRVDPATRTLQELAMRDVRCAIR
jgi:hypothetical protein